MGEMADRWQFSLGYFLLEVFWIAAAFGAILQAIRYPRSHEADVQVLLSIAGITCAGAAVGGLFRDMATGFWLALVLCVLAIGSFWTFGWMVSL